MKKKTLIIIGILVVLIAVIVVARGKKTKEVKLFAKVEKGDFEVLVEVTGELEAMNMEKILAPRELMSDLVRMYQVKIDDIIPEGTVVDSGEYVASLDRTDITTRLRDIQDEVDRQKTNLEKVQLDTTISLRDLRDQLVNMKFDLEEKQIALDQSQYEPPATIRQAQINLDKAKRQYDNSRKNYVLKVRQAQANMREALRNLERQQRRQDAVMDVMNKFVITAPHKGMVIYYKERRGDKRKQGSTINTWDPTVATLPDLSVMISKTYVNEIDISKIRLGQKVRLGVDAFPDRKYTGEVINLSNVGEQLPNTDSKVFEVTIRIDGTDPILRPYMTTSNTIIINTFKDTTYLPIETIHSQDSIPFVYTKSGQKQIVVLGEMNENEIIIEKGLKPGQEVYLNIPEKADNFKMVGDELIPLIKEKEAKKKKEKEEFEKRLKDENDMRKKMRQMPGQRTNNNGSRPAELRPQSSRSNRGRN